MIIEQKSQDKCKQSPNAKSLGFSEICYPGMEAIKNWDFQLSTLIEYIHK